MESICGANCEECVLFKNSKCKGCKETNGCPFGKQCWIHKYITSGGIDNLNQLKKN